MDRGRVLAVDGAPITDRGIRPDQPVRGQKDPLEVALAEAQAMLK